MIELNLKKAKQFQDFTIQFPDTGLILLSGDSGAGKSSIFESIVDALWGEGDDMPPWGESKSAIGLKCWGLDIIRSRGPKALLVNGASDMVGQEKINDLLQMSYSEFMASSYIQQKQKNSLLTLTPAEQLEFIQKLSSGSFDPGKFTSQLLNKKSLIDRQFEITTQSLSIENSRLDAALVNLSQKQTVYDLLSKSSMKDEGERIRRDSEELTRLQKEKDIIYAQLSQTNQLEKLKKEQTDIQLKLQAINQIKDRLSVLWISHNNAILELSKLPEIETAVAVSVDYKSHLACFQWWERQRAFAAKISPLIKDANGSNLGEKLNHQLLGTQNELKDQQIKIKDLSTEIAMLELNKHAQSCPECETPLTINGGKLVKGNCYDETQVTEKKQDLKNLETSVISTHAFMGAIQKALGEYGQLIDEYKKLVIKTTNYTIEELTELDMAQHAAQKKAIEDATNQGKRNSINQLILNVKQEVSALEHKLSAEPSEKDLQNRQVELNGQVSFAEQEINTTKQKLNEVQTKINQFANLSSDISNFKQYELQLLTATNELQFATDVYQKQVDICRDLTIQSDKYANSAGSIKRALDLSKKASMESIEALLDSINHSASTFLSAFFPTEGTSIQLKNSFETQKGEQRARISLEIFHKGKMPKKLSSLSGGEESRITLAFQIALSELYNSPILLIDEGFVGLPIAQKLECLEMLRPLSQKKLVCVIEHGMPECAFDSVINI